MAIAKNQDIKLAVDAIVFGYNQNELQVLLVKQKFGEMANKWVLPGGFVNNDEPLKDAVIRELNEEAGIKVDYLEQLYTYGDNVHRDPRGRVVSVAYYALVDPSQFNITAGSDAKDAKWFPLLKVPKTGYDHNKMIQYAATRLSDKIQYQPIGFELLADKFPFSDLENLYITILGKQIDRRNFRKKVLASEILIETNEFASNAVGRPGKLYQFDKSRYYELTKSGWQLDLKFL